MNVRLEAEVEKEPAAKEGTINPQLPHTTNLQKSECLSQGGLRIGSNFKIA